MTSGLFAGLRGLAPGLLGALLLLQEGARAIAAPSSYPLPPSVAAAPALAAFSGPSLAPSPSSPSSSFTRNHDLARWCDRVVTRLPRIDRKQCTGSDLKPTGAVSVKRVPILSRRINADKGARNPLRILLVGGIHGDELTSSAVVFEWMQSQAAAKRQDFHWHIVPILNPDGLLARKPSRMNASGVDLNRNFPTPGWHKEAPAWWVQKTHRDPRRYPGRSPLSEPETRWLHEEIERFRPDLVVSVHAPFGVLDFDGPAPPPKRFGNLRFDRVGVYPGSLGNYGGHYKKIPVVTIELPNARAMPTAVETRRIWDDMRHWIDRNLPAGPLATVAGDKGAQRRR